MKIKICGMKHPENIKAIQKLQPDLMGFIFYEKSLRCVDQEILQKTNLSIKDISTVGVFVNTSISDVIEIAEKFSFDFIQLHGNETSEYVKKLYDTGLKIIKAFQIKEDFDWKTLQHYAMSVSYFLFDTPTEKYGGSGKKFNWEHLKKYNEKNPFFLSGGITGDDIQEIKNLKMPLLYGIDVNSKFETEPGRKDEEMIKKMINQVRNGSKI
ncbi:MAG TPA: phosphoribosylanthranilate isomerase [Brumimicrobium sp.]|nr:phosphoribosylanthranilate isomerase [Brumimicrobium sp.]